MGYCIPIISALSKIYVDVWTFFLKFFIHLNGVSLVLAGLLISSVLLFISLKILGKLGGFMLILIGIIGAFFSFGTSLIISVIGFVLLIFGESANLILIGNILVFILAIICSI
jgi:hypothetical protein